MRLDVVNAGACWLVPLFLTLRKDVTGNVRYVPHAGRNLVWRVRPVWWQEVLRIGHSDRRRNRAVALRGGRPMTPPECGGGNQGTGCRSRSTGPDLASVSLP